MIPLRDIVRPQKFPVITTLLIITMSLIFAFQLSLKPAALNLVVQNFGLVPAHVSDLVGLAANPYPLVTLVTSIFLHSGWFHFLSNVWMLFVFGGNVEEQLGHGRFLLFYLLSGLAANLTHALVYPPNPVPAIGASGAIAGVMGAYLLFFPRARIVTLIPVFLIPWFVEIPALVYLGFWFVSQLFSGLFSLVMPAGERLYGIAWWAHIGGFLCGIILARLFVPTNWSDTPGSKQEESHDHPR